MIQNQRRLISSALCTLACAIVIEPTPAAESKVDANKQTKPNIILIFADDISARELPIYGSTVWTAPDKSNTSDPKFRARTPVLDQLAREGCWFGQW